MRSRTFIWGISSSPCGKARLPKSRRTGQESPAFWQNGESGSITKRVYPDGRIERCENVKDVSQYIERIGEMIESILRTLKLRGSRK